MKRSARRFAPPFSLPAEHFAAALVWLVLGSAGLVAVAPDLARGGFLQFRVVAVTHLFTLGWITTTLFGALYEIAPVALQTPARGIRTGHAGFWALTGGIACLAGGSWFQAPVWLAPGWLLILAAVGVHIWNLRPPSDPPARVRYIGPYVQSARLVLVLALLLIGANIGAYQGWWSVDRTGILAAHAHLAAVGFATLAVVGVGSRLLPMFLLARVHPSWPLRWIGPLLLVGLCAFAGGTIRGVGALEVGGGVVLAASLALYLYLAGSYFRRRERRRLGSDLVQMAVAHAFLGVATVLGLGLLLSRPADPQAVAAYGVVGILGWLALMVGGVYARIVPFLRWLHRFGKRAGEPGVPRIGDLGSGPLGWIRLLLLSAGAGTLALAIDAASRSGAVLGAGIFGLGALSLALEVVRSPGAARSEPARAGADRSAESGGTRHRLDVRPILARGEEPLNRILASAERIPEGGALEIVAPFEPVPLCRALARRGFAHRARPESSGAWIVRFTRTSITPSSTIAQVFEAYPATEAVLADHGLDLCCGRDKTLEFAAGAHALELDELLAELHRAACPAD
ncbi:MAG: DUF2249 domain-containing protein [Gemmatimonadota bacterium]